MNIQYSVNRNTGWTASARFSQNPAMRRSFRVEKLSDEFGQYDLILKCHACGHERNALPRTLAKICGWDASFEDLKKRLRCSKCGKRQCELRAFPQTPPRKHHTH